MAFGRTIQGDQVAYWGARAIYQGYSRNYHVDLLPDRQTGDNVSDAFLFWLNNRALPWLQAEVRKQGLGTDSTEVLSLTEYKYHIEATPNGSYGYLYIGAAVKLSCCWPSNPFTSLESLLRGLNRKKSISFVPESNDGQMFHINYTVWSCVSPLLLVDHPARGVLGSVLSFLF